MIPKTFVNLQRNNLLKFKTCKKNCLCVDRLKIIYMKTPKNIIDQTFINFQIQEQKREYIKCFENTIN